MIRILLSPRLRIQSISNPSKSYDLLGFCFSDNFKIFGCASTYFWLKYAGGKMTIIESNDNDVEPVEVDLLIIAVS